VTVASSTSDDGLLVVRSEAESQLLLADLLSGERVHAIVALACVEQTDEPLLWHEEVRTIVGPKTRIYFIAEDELLDALRETLGRKLALTPESARIWWPGLSTRSDPCDHPLVLALEGEPRAEILAEFARQFDLSRPHVRRELKLSGDACALAEHQLAQVLARDERTAERLRDAHRERHREATRAETAEARLAEALQRLDELAGAGAARPPVA
jgi:hypothetical protein